MAKSSIGLDIGTTAVRAAEVSVRGGSVQLLKFGQVSLPDGAVADGQVVDVDAVAAAIRELWRGAKIAGRKVHLGVSNQNVSVRQATLPWMPPEEFRASLRFQAVDLVPMAVEDAVLDFVPLREETLDSDRSVHGLLVVAAQAAIEQAVRAATAAGLHPVGVDLVPFALMRAVGGRVDGDDATEAIVDVGSRLTNVVVHRGGYPLFVRVLLQGGQDLTRAMLDSTAGDLPTAEALKRGGPDLRSRPTAAAALDEAIGRLAEEVRGSLDYYQATNPGPAVSRIVLSGAGAQAHGLADRLASRTRVPVVHARPFASVTFGRTGLSPEQLAFVESAAAVPVGLAMGGAA